MIDRGGLVSTEGAEVSISTEDTLLREDFISPVLTAIILPLSENVLVQLD